MSNFFHELTSNVQITGRIMKKYYWACRTFFLDYESGYKEKVCRSPELSGSKNISFYPSFHTFAIKLLIIALAVCWLMNFLQTFSILKILSQTFKPLNFLLFLSLIRLNNIHPHQHDRWTDPVDNQYFFLIFNILRF